ncbi:hypothetical protein Trydic_g893 [Trypoxylus dichotomus]
MLTSKRTLDMPPNIQHQILKAYTYIEEKNAKCWPEKWGWILREYDDLKAKLKDLSEHSIVYEEPKKDLRKILPVPKSVNHEYGWICTKPEFRLQVYGADVPNYKIPKKYMNL